MPWLLVLALIFPSIATCFGGNSFQQWNPPQVAVLGDTTICAAFQDIADNNDIKYHYSPWRADTNIQIYLQWLQKNLESGVNPQDLSSHDPQVIQHFQKLDHEYILVLLPHQNQVWALLFASVDALPSGYHLNEPVAIKQWPLNYPHAPLAQELLDDWFSGNDTHEKSANYQPVDTIAPEWDFRVGTDFGWTQAALPLFPHSWWAPQLEDRVQNYRYVQDSSSAWNLLEDESYLWALRLGFTWQGFLGLDAFVQHSNHPVKWLTSDPAYSHLEYWGYSRWETGLLAHWLWNTHISHNVAWQQELAIGMHYSFLQENVTLQSHFVKTENYESRIQLNSFYKGALASATERLLFYKHFGVLLRININNRTHPGDTDGKSDIIAQNTLDYQALLGLEWHWQSF